MEFVNIAQFRKNASVIFNRLEEHGEMVVLKNGRPVGYLVAATASDLDALRVALQRARAQRAAERLRATVIAPKQIVEVIGKTRRELRTQGPSRAKE